MKRSAQTALLSQKFVNSLKPTDTEYAVYDSLAPGFGIRVFPSGVKSFIFVTTLYARAIRRTIGRFPDLTVDQARVIVQKWRGEIAQGIDPEPLRLPSTTEPVLQDALDLWFEYIDRHKVPVSRRSDRAYASRLPAAWKTRPLRAIRQNDVQKWFYEFTDQHGPSAGNHAFRFLRAVFNYARKNGLCDHNPCVGIRMNAETSRARFATPDEIKRLNEALENEIDYRFRALFPLALLTGLRCGALVRLRWEQIRLHDRIMEVENTKAKKPEHRKMLLPISPQAAAILEQMPSRGTSEFVFPSERGNVHISSWKKAWERIISRAGISDLRVHDLRRTVGSWMVAKGKPTPVVMSALGHTTLTAAQIYQRANLTTIGDAFREHGEAVAQAGLSVMPEPSAEQIRARFERQSLAIRRGIKERKPGARGRRGGGRRKEAARHGQVE